MLLFEDVTIEAGGRRILDGVGLAVRRGERFGIVASDPAERTAIAALLTGDRVPATGRVRVDGLDPVRDAAWLVGRVSQDPDRPGQADVLLVQTPATSTSHLAREQPHVPAGTQRHGQPHRTVLLLCDDVAAARWSCDRVAVLERGRVVAIFETATTVRTAEPTSTRSTS